MATSYGPNSARNARCVFAHDHVFIENGGTFASRSGLPQPVLERYADAFGEVDVICRSRSDPQSTVPPISDSRIRFHPMSNLRSASGLRRLKQVRSEIAEIVTEADCVVARLPSAIGMLAAVAARRHGKPFAIEVAGNAMEANLFHGSRIGPLVAPIEHMMCRAIVKMAPITIYITTDYLQRIYPTAGRAFICPNVYIEEVISSTGALRRPKAVTDQWTLGLVGSLDVSYKGHEVAIAALSKLKEKLPHVDLRLQFAGGGSTEKWQRMAAAAGVGDRVEFLGTIPPGAAMREWYDTVDIMIHPSQVEAQGRSIIEAMSRGRPVVASRVGGIPELIAGEYLVDARDADGLAEIAAKLIIAPDRYMAAAARNLEKAKTFLKPTVERQRTKAFDCLWSQIRLAS